MVESLIAEYRLDPDQAELIGEGGGAGALIPFVSEKTGLRFRISENAEVISSIGVALALVRETVERTIPNVRPEDIAMIKREAFDAVVRLGAAPGNVEVTVEVDPQTQRVRATAMGSSEMRAQDLTKEIDEAEGRTIAAASMSIPEEAVTLAANTGQMRVFQGTVTERKWRVFSKTRRPVRAIDREGVIRVQRSNATVNMAPAGQGLGAIRGAVGVAHHLQWRQQHHARPVRAGRRPCHRSERHRRRRAGACGRQDRVLGPAARRHDRADRRGGRPRHVMRNAGLSDLVRRAASAEPGALAALDGGQRPLRRPSR